jgi:prephenate dehydrogenase
MIGTSIGMALKKAKLPSYKVTGHDLNDQTARRSRSRGAVDKLEFQLAQSVKDADIVIIATPVLAIRDVLESISSALPETAVVTDTGSTKQQVLKWAEELLPRRVGFVGGHPMAGVEKPGPEDAKPDMFADSTYCLMPSRGASARDVQTVVDVVETLGATPLFIHPQEHDSFVAAVSHVPIALSTALIAATTGSPSWHEMGRLAAGGYRDVTRLASGDPTMNRDICLTNGTEIVGWLDRIIEQLQEFKGQVQEQNKEVLTRLFETVNEERLKWVEGILPRPGARPAVEIPGVVEQTSRTLFGEAVMIRMKRLLDFAENPPKKQGKDGDGPSTEKLK